MKNRTTPGNIQELQPNQILVFGSNGFGWHSAGAARLATEKFGASPGQSFGLQGRSFGIVSMEGIHHLRVDIKKFIRFAEEHPELTFLVTEIGCGIAGYSPEEIAPLFKRAVHVENIHLPDSFWRVLGTTAL